jgi:hypothetical protein
MMQDVHVKLNPELSWQNQHSTRRRLFSPANWTTHYGRDYVPVVRQTTDE